MANKKINSVNLLPEFLRTDRNKKFLSSTIDQLIQPAQLERINGFVGSAKTPTYNSTADTYISSGAPYQLDPALIINDNLGNIQSVQGYDDLINELAVKGSHTDNLDRLFRSSVYSYNPHVDWDKLVNYQNYYWLPTGPEPLEVVADGIDIAVDVEGQTYASVRVLTTTGVSTSTFLSNGMLISFSGVDLPLSSNKYEDKEFYVEGVGTSIRLVDRDTLLVSEKFINYLVDGFDDSEFDTLPFDNNREIPVLPEYVTINRSSRDLNPWSRYNRWVHKDVVKISAEINGVSPAYESFIRAQRPIIEFKPDIQLFNFGTNGIESVDLLDTHRDTVSGIVGSTSPVYIDGVLLEQGHRVVFTALTDHNLIGKVFEVNFTTVGSNRVLGLTEVYVPQHADAMTILLGNTHSSSDWLFDGITWQVSQQRETLNQPPLFDLYDFNGVSYANRDYYLSNFEGNKIFSYMVGAGVNDKYLGYPLSYRNTDAIGSILFENNLMTETIIVSQLDNPTYTISSNVAYCKIGNSFENAWTKTLTYPIPLITSTDTSITSYYEEPLSLTNNPLNGTIPEFTISELAEHVQTMIDRSGTTNLRDYPDCTNYGIKLISSANPIAFAQMFIGKKENSLIDAISKTAEQYNQFKDIFLNYITIHASEQQTPADAVNEILTLINQNKNDLSPYFLSDMLGYGNPEIFRNWIIDDINIKSYPLSSEFDLNELSLRSVLVYLNKEQLVYDVDYTFNKIESTVDILRPLRVGDVLVVNDYTNTEGAYVPPTPTKLGLYPKFVPSIFVDDTYNVPTTVIQCHDGSIIVSYGDYRDAIILELEKRIYNNIKVNYNSELLDYNFIMPGAFRQTSYTLNEVNEILENNFAKWAGKYSIDYAGNSFYDPLIPKTWNYYQSYISEIDVALTGSWRAVFKNFYDTDRPHTHPWEMLGYSTKPDWWQTTYGSYPYPSNNRLWIDLELGYDAGKNRNSVLYARPGLAAILPVDNLGNLKDLTDVITSFTESNKQRPWIFGDQGQAETAWRRSSYWPFAVQHLLALTIPATYASLMYDTSRVQKNISNQWTYGKDESFFRLRNLFIHGENNTLTSGYSVMVVEAGKQRTTNYVSELRSDIEYASYNLLHKVGGFVDKDTLQITIDAFEPTSNSIGSVLPSQNYKLILNTGNPIKSVSISGLIIQILDGQFIVKGYDTRDNYFTVFAPIRNLNTPAITIGGISSEYVRWESSGSSGATGLTAVDTITANSAATGHFYQEGQFVLYGNNFYRVTVSHRAGPTFNPSYFQILKSLPVVGGATVQQAGSFSNIETKIPYGTAYSNIQDVYDLIIGYGRWTTSQGFEFNGYNKNLESVIDWNFTAKEFLYWTTQHWASGSVITLSPFADQLVYNSKDSVVDNIFDSFYQYSISRADGTPFPQTDLSITRESGLCTIGTLPNTDGIYFARLNLVQKEHAIIFDNKTIFGDVIYDVETGSRQHRVKLSGFRTANWAGDFFSPGFVYDNANVNDWVSYKDYKAGDTVRFGGNYYSAIKNIDGSKTFDFSKWSVLPKKPVSGLLPNLDYKISQFEDFYSLDSDNFDGGQQRMAQHLTGYTPRTYLNNIFTDPVSQYKFYQGFIREKGTKNAIDKLSKVSRQTLSGEITYNEEWAFRIGNYGSFLTYQELEIPLTEGTFFENPQIIKFVETKPVISDKDLLVYRTPGDLLISPDSFNPLQTFSSTSSQDTLLLTHAGYVRVDDVTVTAYNESSLLDIANSNSLKDGDTIWLGFKPNGGWDVYRYTYSPAGIVGVFVSAPLSTITFTTQYPHNLSAGQIIGVSHFNSQVDGIYIVQAVNSKQFTVNSTLASIENAPLPVPGQLYKFVSARVSNFDSLPSDKELFRLPNGTKFWIDPSDSRGWEVYEKINNYLANQTISSNLPVTQGFGSSISKRSGDNIIVVGAPTFYRGNQYGAVYVYRKEFDGSLTNIVRYRLNKTSAPTGFGKAVVYDDIPFSNSLQGLIFAGAPDAYSSSGTVKISSINSRTLTEGTSTYLINPNSLNGKFGTSIFVERNTSTKTVLVGAPASAPTGVGAVYSYKVADSSGTIVVSSPIPLIDNSLVFEQNSQWGYSIDGAEDASILAIGAPGYFTNTGVVTVFDKSLKKIATLRSPFNKNGRFGESVSVSPSGDYIFVAAPAVINTDESLGQVVVYTVNSGTVALDQILENPVVGAGMKFGKDIDVSTDSRTLAISSLGTNNTFFTTFDSGQTLFDGGITKIKGTEPNSGAVYIYYKQNNRFVLSQELTTSTIAITPGTDYGTSIVLDNNLVYVGAPALDNNSVPSSFYEFNKINTGVNSLDLIRFQEELVKVNTVTRASLIDTSKDNIVEYLDVIDPLKGKIAGIADQELTYRLINDPAIYSLGITGVNADTGKNWLDDHVGELWWDLSSAKYIWYEQSDLEYRRNNWGKLFPGATIDVYEWVGSTLLPSEWSSQADTPIGLTKGISGQPRYADNSVISVKQVYDVITNSFSNVYYYWVKNKVTIPNSKNRRISSYEVATIIADPVAYGLKFASIISKDAVTLSNIGSMLVDNKISLNISQVAEDSIVLPPKHTEWLLLQEGSASSMPNELLEKKLIDSLLGHDNLGNIVPSPALSHRTRYGLGIRPQQTLFGNRLEALRNIIEFSNSVLEKKLITGKYSFKNLNAQEEIPNEFTGEYDFLVEDNNELSIIDTTGFQQAVVNCIVNGNGEVSQIYILSHGHGYATTHPVYNNTGTLIGYQGPSFETIDHAYRTTFDGGTTTFDAHVRRLSTSQQLYGTPYVNDSTSESRSHSTEFIIHVDPNIYGRNIKISTLVDANGSISSASLVTILDPGEGYSGNFKFIARPQTAYVLSDDTYNGKWTKFTYDYVTSSWDRAKTQSFNTTLYWKYIDWMSANYDNYRIYSAIIGSPYELSELELVEGQYVKINNGGDGRYIVLEKIANSIQGTYEYGYDIVYSQNGSIQLNSSLWDLLNSGLGWDYINTYDQTLYDQTPDVELQYILKALKNDIFISELKVNWNLLFFKAVKYAFTEQKLLDWAFKTSFINITNNAGTLNQPPVYKLQDSAFYEKYVDEVKPYHTKVRNFTTEYASLDISNNKFTDFDFPWHQNTLTGLLVSSEVNPVDVVNNPVRHIATTIKFDRISTVNSVGDFTVNDTFVADGETTEFVLNWVPNLDPSKIVVKVNGILGLTSQWTLTRYTELYQGYNKEYGKIVLFFVPPKGTIISATYEKDAVILNAVERILGYYTNTNGLFDLGSLMNGIDYPGTSIDGRSLLTSTNATFTSSYIDSLISGGTFINGQLISALGVNPADLTIDGGRGFLSPQSSHAPEEFVPGYAIDSLGISVYTKGPSLAPTLLNGTFAFAESTTTLEFTLVDLPPTVASLTVILDVANDINIDNDVSSDISGVVLEYVSNSEFTDINQYSLDWNAKKIIIQPQPDAGILGYSIIGVGSSTENAFGYIDKGYFYAVNATSARVDSTEPVTLVRDALVTVNGQSVPRIENTSTSTIGFMLLSDAPNDGDGEFNLDRNAFIRVYNLDPMQTYFVQAWFFAETHKNFNDIKEQTFAITSQNVSVPIVLDISYDTMVEPLSSQAIVEITDSLGTRRLLPPDTNYYSVTDVINPVFPVTISSDNASALSTGTVRVFKNGHRITGTNYTFVYPNVIINTSSVSLSVGDAIAIESLVPEVIGYANTLTNSGYDYRIEGNLLFLAPQSQSQNSTSTITTATIKVITYNDRDSMLKHTERFVGNPNRRFRLSRPIMNSKYVWVTLLKKEYDFNTADFYFESYGLINGVDFTVLDDNVTVQLADEWNVSLDDFIEIISFKTPSSVPSVLGYRIFNDMLGRKTYTRLSKKHTTYLTRPLRYTDTEIYIADETVLTPPNVDRNIPGVILIDAERIEFWKVKNNVLSEITRGTLGTGPAYYLDEGTRVIDQGVSQVIPSTDNIKIQNTFTNISNVYPIGKTDMIITSPTDPSIRLRYDPITLSTATGVLPIDFLTINTITNRIKAIDQVEVYYGGHRLRKAGHFKHETTATFDSITEHSIIGKLNSSTDLSSISPGIGDSYLIEHNDYGGLLNEVWTYTGSRTASLTKNVGWVYTGLKYIPADFSIRTHPRQELVLNTSTIAVRHGVKISIVKQDFAYNNVWNETITNTWTNSTDDVRTLSLIDSDTPVANFLKEAPAELPDNYYYGGDLKLTDENGEPLLNGNGTYLTGYN
jgi:hypothetical protein